MMWTGCPVADSSIVQSYKCCPIFLLWIKAQMIIHTAMTPQTPKNTKNSISFSFFEVKQIIHQETCSRKQNDDKQSYAEQQVGIDIKFHHPGKHDTSENQFRDIQTIITEFSANFSFRSISIRPMSAKISVFIRPHKNSASFSTIQVPAPPRASRAYSGAPVHRQ